MSPEDRVSAVEVLRRQVNGVNVRLDRGFGDFVETFAQHDVRFLVVGGFAVAVHGYPRFTRDLDAWILVDPKNAERVMRALRALGFGACDLSPSDFEAPDVVIQLGNPPHRIDLLTSIDGVEFRDAWERRVIVHLGSVEVPVIGRDDLLVNKREVHRPQDLADVAAIEGNANLQSD